MFSWEKIKQTYKDEVEGSYGDNVGKVFGMAKVLGMSAVAGATAVVKNAPDVLEKAGEANLRNIDNQLKNKNLSDEQRMNLEIHRDKVSSNLDGFKNRNQNRQ